MNKPLLLMPIAIIALTLNGVCQAQSDSSGDVAGDSGDATTDSGGGTGSDEVVGEPEAPADSGSAAVASTTPIVFQAAGPNAASIQSTVDAFRAALGNPNNANNPGPLSGGRREINWDGGGVDNTTPPVTPFNVFLDTRGAQFATLKPGDGDGLTQAPPQGGPEGGLAALFSNPSYGTIFATFSSPRLFAPVDTNIVHGFFAIPGTNGGALAVVSGFGAVFTDVDRPTGQGRRGNRPSTKIEYFSAENELLFTGVVPASPGDASLSFFGVVFPTAVVARVKITSGDTAPGPNDGRRDIVVMDDFLYGEPQPVVP
jgi:hypothetical protein